MDLKKLYTEGLKEGRYESLEYNMTRFDETHKELSKTLYIADRKEREKRLRELVPNERKNRGSALVPRREQPLTYEQIGFESAADYAKYLKTKKMIYNNWVWLSFKRQTELENYIIDRFENAEQLKPDPFKAICYLIDEQYKYHTGVFDDPIADYIFRDEYNQYFFDAFQQKIREISNVEVTPINEVMTAIIKKPLKWNAKKTSIGTLFGLLCQEGIIQGNKTDVVRALNGMFVNLSPNTLADNIKLSTKPNEAKTLYDTETESLVKDWIGYLKDSTPKTKKR